MIMSTTIPLPPGPENLVELFEDAVSKFSGNLLFGTKNAAKDGYDWVTYGEVAERVENLRGGLAGLGIGQGDGVAIIANNRVDWAVAAYATYGLRGRFIPMYEAELPRIMKYIIENSGTKLVFVSNKEILKKVKDFPKEIKSLEKIILLEGTGKDTMAELEKAGKKKPVPSQHPKPDDIAGLIYTSGTTGNPKGVMLSHFNLATNVRACYACYPALCETDRTLSFLPWAHSFGQVVELHLLVTFGGSTGFAEGPTTIVGDLALVKPTLLVAVPRVFNKIYDALYNKMEETGGLARTLFHMGLKAGEKKRQGKGGLLNSIKHTIADKIVFSKIRLKFGGNLQMAISSSAALNKRIAEFFDDIGIPVYESWGMTELSPAHTANTPFKSKPGTIGYPIPGSWIDIDKSVTGKESPDGEIIAYGPNVMIGYHGLPKETAEVLREDGGLATGDRGWIDEDGFLHITGRLKEQYKLENGKYVFPAALEETIKFSPYIENAMVEGANKQYNVAIIIPDQPNMEIWAKENGVSGSYEEIVNDDKVKQLMMDEIARLCKEYARYELPRKILMVAEPFTTENGILTQTLKLKRREVMKLYGDAMEALYGE
jgi:long-chain acyl-CoA synthetase